MAGCVDRKITGSSSFWVVSIKSDTGKGAGVKRFRPETFPNGSTGPGNGGEWMKRVEEKKKKRGSELFRTLVITSEKYLRDYTDGKQQDDEKAKLALRVLSVYRRMLKIEKERKVLRLEWERLKKAVAAWKVSSESKTKPRKRRVKG